MTEGEGHRPIYVRLQLIGPIQAFSSSGRSLLPRSRKAQALLGVLALLPAAPVQRSRLAALLWERAEPDQARNLLRGAVHELQKSLLAAQGHVLQAAREHISLRRDNVQIDAEEIFRPLSREGAKIKSTMAGLVLLDGFETVGDAFDKWLSALRLSFQERVKSAFEENVEVREAASSVDLRDQACLRTEAGHFPQLHGRTAHTPSPPQPDELTPAAYHRDHIHGREQDQGSHRSASGSDIHERAKLCLPVARTDPLRRRGGVRIGVTCPRSFSASETSDLPLILADEISGALARFRWMSVISSESVAAALGPHRDVQAACVSLGLDFLLDGQIQTNGGKVRIRASLLSARDGSIVWTFKTDRDLCDLLTFQDEVAAEIAALVDSHALSREVQRAAMSGPRPVDAYGLVLQAIPAVCRLDRLSFQDAGMLLEEALRAEPDNIIARISSAQFHMIAASQGWTDDPRTALKRAEEDAAIALLLDPSEARALTISGHVRSLLHEQPSEATTLHQKALETNPNLSFAWHLSAANFLVLGDVAQARRCLERYRQLAHSSINFFAESSFILLHLLDGDYEAVVKAARTVVHMHPNFVAAYKPYLAALGHLGLQSEAHATRVKLLSLEPKLTLNSFLDTAPCFRSEDMKRYANGLRLSGLE